MEAAPAPGTLGQVRDGGDEGALPLLVNADVRQTSSSQRLPVEIEFQVEETGWLWDTLAGCIKEVP